MTLRNVLSSCEKASCTANNTSWALLVGDENQQTYTRFTEVGQTSLKINSTLTPSFYFFPFLFRRRREKLQAHLKESRSLKNYTANSHNALDAKMRLPNTNLQMHEVTTGAFCPPILTFF